MTGSTHMINGTEDIRERARRVLDRLEDEQGEHRLEPSRRPLDELVLTILSQNTSDVNTNRAFESLRTRIPEWKDVRRAPTGDVIDAIRHGGLARQKGPRIQAVLQQLADHYHVEDNDSFASLLGSKSDQEALAWMSSFRGVGPKTAACVLLFGLGRPVLPVDTHVHRVTGRIGLISPGTNAVKAHADLASIVADDRVYSFHVSLINHGRKVCKAPTPRCSRCVLQDLCLYYQRTRETGE